MRSSSRNLTFEYIMYPYPSSYGNTFGQSFSQPFYAAASALGGNVSLYMYIYVCDYIIKHDCALSYNKSIT